MRRVGWCALVMVAAWSVTGPAGAVEKAAEETPKPSQAAGSVAERLVGEWAMFTEFQGDHIPATMIISLKDGKFAGVWISTGQEMKLMELEFDGKAITFKRTMGAGGLPLEFDGTLENDEISGHYLIPSGQRLPCKGKRKE